MIHNEICHSPNDRSAGFIESRYPNDGAVSINIIEEDANKIK